jgi:hypothetical protein
MKKLMYLLIVLTVTALMFSCDEKKGSSNTDTFTTDPCDENERIGSLETEVRYLKEQRDDLARRLKECEDYFEVEPGKKVVTTKKTTSVAKKVPTKSATVVKKEYAPKPTTSVKKESAPVVQKKSSASFDAARGGTANLDYLRQAGKILFCTRVNYDDGKFFPQYAINQGVNFEPGQIELNPSSDGHNFKVEPTDFYDGDFGVTTDGVFFVSEELILSSLRSGEGIMPADIEVELISSFNNWKLTKMNKVDGYFVLKTQ